MYLPEFTINANNVYRTKHFIVKQVFKISYDEFNNAVIISNDTYYKRTMIRNLEYKSYYKHKVNINGKRVHSTMQTRRYVN